MRHRSALVLSLLFALGSCHAPAFDGLVAQSRQLDDREPHRTRLGEVEVLSIHQLKSAQPGFGGISGISCESRTATAISDVGHWLRFTMDVDGQGRPVAFGDLAIARLGGIEGRKDDSDAEEVTATPEGWVVSFERRHRLLFYRDGMSGKPERLSAPPSYDSQPENGGVEAVT
ncbi:MAG TPA: hypothetical protein VK196_14305, partial [Magnetospirillum sp.]|nr:hypothetical protein [Magnetospirillum sp.]